MLPNMGEMPPTIPGMMGQPMNMMDDAATASTQGQPVEFDHAINYVTKIKKRFSSDAETYKTFLDILHSYQNEQRSIKEVLDQVSDLFRDHADLLKEFTYFLPDAVRESAKNELVKRAAKAQKANARKKAGKGSKKSAPISEPDQEESRIPQLERNLLGRIKDALGTRELWGEFLKCLDLFAQELISRAELLALVSDIFGERADLLEEFDRLLASRGATDDPVESAWFSMPLTDINFANCRRCTPSYRALPAAYPKAPCSERTAMCRSVLNDTWVSVPLGSEDTSGKNYRRNQYQEALFKCEDDRYEVDLVIDSNKAAIRALEPLAREIEALSANNPMAAKFRYRLEKRTLSVIHLKAIARIYGDHGTEILELLRRNPAGAIPVILRRLKEKDAEWCKDREELNKNWKDIMERNYMKSLDHRSFYFKQAEKRAYTQKVLLHELREKKTAESGQDAPGPAEALAPAGVPSGADHIELAFDDPQIHQDAWSLLAVKVEKQCDSKEWERIGAFYAYFAHTFFRMPAKWLKQGEALFESLHIHESADQPTRKSRSEPLPAGTSVQTPYGVGVVKDYQEETGFYCVQLGFGFGYIRAAVVETGLHKHPARTAFSKEVVMHDDDAERAVTGDAESPSANLFVSSSVYVFMRQYELLCKRLLQAKRLCESSSRPPRRVKHVVDRAHEEEAVSGVARAARASGDAEGADGAGMEVDEEGAASAAESQQAPSIGSDYTQLLSLVYCHLNGAIESTKFEDECRNLVGPEIYFLFTVDKLVSALQKALSSVVADEKAAEVARQLKAFSSSKSSLDLANAYNSSFSHLVQPEGNFFRMRFFPGTLKTAEERVAEENDQGPLAVPAGAIVKPEPKVVTPWKLSPRVCFSVVDRLPILEELPPGETADTFATKPCPAPCPIQIEVTDKLNIARQAPMTDVERLAGLAPEEPGANSMSLPIYRVAQLSSSREVAESVAVFAEANPSENTKKARADTWFASRISEAESGSEGSGAGAAANGTDVEMKDA